MQKSGRIVCRQLFCVRVREALQLRPDGSIYINRSGNSGMAVAGSGDVLTGIVTALLSTIDDPFWALCIGVYLHGLAGDLAAHTKGEYSMTSNDIAEAVWAVLVKQEKNYV